ncbi:glycosyltransferase family 4 protein [Saccharothrix deserti]|uniref:glycosyltransferase family 4 protein n=1 Tax=Saccharothrix deserti TaxID=2593674 RepID=UPI00131CB5A5|nr:glycosyltransferase family 4 protein [Saccharothrix deserti]
MNEIDNAARDVPKILYLTEYWPWPANSGSRLRAAATVEALAAIGQVDIVFVDRAWTQQSPDGPSPLSGSSVRIEAGPAAPPRETEVGYPSDVLDVCRRHGTRLREAVRRHRYDVIWCNRIQTWAPLRGDAVVPTVIDVDDLNDRLNAQNFAHTRDTAFARDAVLWGTLQRDAVQEADQVVTCSELDRQRLGGPANCSVVPNVYLLPETAVEVVAEERRGPRILLQASYAWPPNVDAARRLVREILPLVRRQVPEAEVWLVGMNLGAIDDLAGDGVRIFGLVPDARAYVRAADVVAVPLRQGSGTRIKVLEAFAIGTPVVSTVIGAEGIDARDGEHLLLADEPEDFAEAVLRLLRDRAAAEQLADRARQLVQQEYDRETLLRTVRATVLAAQAAFRQRAGSRTAPFVATWN